MFFGASPRPRTRSQSAFCRLRLRQCSILRNFYLPVFAVFHPFLPTEHETLLNLLLSLSPRARWKGKNSHWPRLHLDVRVIRGGQGENGVDAKLRCVRATLLPLTALDPLGTPSTVRYFHPLASADYAHIYLCTGSCEHLRP